ncbi:aldehyde dehydrogenase family protein [Mycobacterium marseillense]|uniref:aldehyde dehydrogenase family protein n=1 Tax=Mycobacterium marseillense TaxID=701042 RepID=UPI00119F3B00|nr:aldehyde dehydrogenase family protein [Mycobacterium marseillense]
MKTSGVEVPASAAAVAGTLIVGAERVGIAGRLTFKSANPARPADIVGIFPQSTPDDVRRAVDAAAAVSTVWSQTSSIDRGAVLFRAAELLESRSAQASELVVREVGKSRPEATGEVTRGIDILRFFAGCGSAATGDMYPSRTARSYIYSARVPLGPVAVITPWNFPLAIPLWKIAPALIYGNTVIFKPAEEASSVAALLAEVLLESGLPDGVLNVLHGDGRVIGESLFAQPGLRGVTYTGSTPVGRQIELTAVANGLKCQVELGGSNATIVLDDAPVEAAADLVVAAAMKYAGQKCTATSRVIATPGIFPGLREGIVSRVRELRVGDPSGPDQVDVGPVISAQARDQIGEGLQRAVEAGARVLTGGHVIGGDGLDDGYFFAPTVLDRVRPDSELGQEELFGPVLCLLPAGDVDEAIRLANDVRYGLAAAIVTSNLDLASSCIDRLEVGVIKLNSETTGLEPHVPFGGLKDSGSHFPEQGKAAREFFTRSKTVYVQPGASG